MLLLFMNSIALGIGLAMDAFSVCIANGLKEPHMNRSRHLKMASVYAFFQFAMPMIGWACVHLIASKFRTFQKFIPWIALILLLWIGGKMLHDGWKKIHCRRDQKSENEIRSDSSTEKQCLCLTEDERIPFQTILVQGVATSIDALSVGFTIAHLDAGPAFLSCLIIALVTFLICVAGVKLGKIFGDHLDRFADILGGLILIAIGLEIFISSFF